MTRHFVGISLLFVLCGRAAAGLPAEATRPYRLQVVLHIAPHPWITDVFQTQVQRELRDSLQAALGDLARVEVLRDHPRLQEVKQKGLKHALDGWNFLSDAKIHFVLIDFANGRYEIQARQYDGTAGLASPVVRRRSTAERLLVARTAGLLIDNDFGVVGTVTQKDEKKAEVVLKAGGLGRPLSHWIKKDDVFAVTQIVDQSGTGQAAFRVPWTLLQALDDPRDGKCSCQVHHRFDDPLPEAAGVLGYRCLKLGTIKLDPASAPLRLRIVSDDKLGTPLNGRRVQISARGFQDTALEQISTNPEGLVKSVQPYENVAFIKVFDGARPLAKIPVEIVDDRPISIPVSANPEAERSGQLILRRDRWFRRVFDALEVASSVVKDLNATVNDSPQAALKKAESGLKGLETDVKNLTAEHDSLNNDARQSRTPLDLAQGEQHIRELQAQSRELQHYITELSGIDKDPKRQKWKEMVQQGRLLEAAADYEQAITLYEKVMASGGDDPVLRSKLDDLKRLWTIKDDRHRKAHKFIYETWPAAQYATQMKPLLPEARAAIDACKAAGDWLRLRKLYKTNVAHGSSLAKELQSLRQDNEDDRKTLDIIKAVSDELKTQNDEVEQYIRQKQPAN